LQLAYEGNPRVIDAIPERKKLLVIVNPVSGQGNGRDTWNIAKPFFDKANVEYKVKFTYWKGHSEEMI
jgi:diacylglycerol kinase family enzyme